MKQKQRQSLPPSKFPSQGIPLQGVSGHIVGNNTEKMNMFSFFELTPSHNLLCHLGFSFRSVICCLLGFGQQSFVKRNVATICDLRLSSAHKSNDGMCQLVNQSNLSVEWETITTEWKKQKTWKRENSMALKLACLHSLTFSQFSYIVCQPFHGLSRLPHIRRSDSTDVGQHQQSFYFVRRDRAPSYALP